MRTSNALKLHINIPLTQGGKERSHVAGRQWLTLQFKHEARIGRHIRHAGIGIKSIQPVLQFLQNSRRSKDICTRIDELRDLIKTPSAYHLNRTRQPCQNKEILLP